MAATQSIEAVPSQVTDAVVVAITRKLLGPRFNEAAKHNVRSVLTAGAALGYEFTWTDPTPREVA